MVFASNRGDDNPYFQRLPGENPQTLKLSPQEQEALALGLVNLNPPPIILSEKSSSVPLR